MSGYSCCHSHATHFARHNSFEKQLNMNCRLKILDELYVRIGLLIISVIFGDSGPAGHGNVEPLSEGQCCNEANLAKHNIGGRSTINWIQFPETWFQWSPFSVRICHQMACKKQIATEQWAGIVWCWLFSENYNRLWAPTFPPNKTSDRQVTKVTGQGASTDNKPENTNIIYELYKWVAWHLCETIRLQSVWLLFATCMW